MALHNVQAFLSVQRGPNVSQNQIKPLGNLDPFPNPTHTTTTKAIRQPSQTTYSFGLSPWKIPRRSSLQLHLTHPSIMQPKAVSIPVANPDQGIVWNYLSTLLLVILDVSIYNYVTIIRTMLLTIYFQQFELAEVYGLDEEYEHLATFIKDEVRPDDEWLRNTLAHFIMSGEPGEPQEKLRSAKAEFQDTLDQGGVSPFAAFKKVISTTSLAQEMDERYATAGGLDFYITTQYTTAEPSDALRAEAKEAALWRKVEEIKKLMAANKKEETGGSPAPKAEQVAGVIGQGHVDEMEKSKARE